jgi:membrane protein
LGAEISFAVQNVKLKGTSLMFHKLSIAYQKKIALLITFKLVDDFKEGRKAPTADQISSATSIPVHTVDYILEKLIKSELLSKVISGDKTAFQPAYDIRKMDIASVINAFDRSGKDFSHFIKSDIFNELKTRLEFMEDGHMSNEKNILLKDLYAIR